jgi:5-methyltetrahydropteroyltriglutamate--homocysteine methyltransferase
MHIGMHLCRGNRGGHWHAEGGYEEVAERLFNALTIPFYFLEYDTPRAGSFTPLRFVPKDKSIVLGLVSTKMPQLEDKAALKRRLDEAMKFVALDRLSISPQCGFASLDTGNPVTVGMQIRKLELVCELAGEIWGET